MTFLTVRAAYSTTLSRRPEQQAGKGRSSSAMYFVKDARTGARHYALPSLSTETDSEHKKLNRTDQDSAGSPHHGRRRRICRRRLHLYVTVPADHQPRAVGHGRLFTIR